MSILVTGGAGYIGSHVVKQLLEETNKDNLSAGKIEVIERLRDIRPFQFYNLELSEVETIFASSYIDYIIHFAAVISVPESMEDPLKYYLNNTCNTTSLINLAVKYHVKRFIFSSTAAVYGEKMNPDGVSEEDETKPINPYGMSKLMSERILQDTARASDLSYVIFRYFNVAGADMHYENGTLKPRFGHRQTASHLIKMASEAACNKRSSLTIYGTDFNTSDGTGVRDYIHVDDLANAHILAIDKDVEGIFNIGYGKGYSVKEVIETMKQVSGNNFSVVEGERRAGDPAQVISCNEKILRQMNWTPKYDSLELICQSSMLWENR